MSVLARPRDGRVAPPVRIVHLGLGNFVRAHLAWYTDRAPDADQWGIAAFTGRSTELADQLADQGGLYQLAVQAPEGDEVTVVSSIVETHPGGDVTRLVALLARPEVAIVSTTITEAGYCRAADDRLALDAAPVAADLDLLRHGADTTPALDALTTAVGRLLAGLRARRDAGCGGLTFVPCDNLPGNGDALRRVLLDGARVVDPDLADWLDQHCSFASSMVDRITPRATEADRTAVAELTGVHDPAVVVTEPFCEWVLSGRFVAGRPAWAEAGVTMVDDVAPHELRKLTLLNGAHSLMAVTAPLLGHQVVNEAISDPTVRGWVDQWWQEAIAHLVATEPALTEADLRDYTEALVERFANPRIRHQLGQIATDSSQKIPVRITPTLRAGLNAATPPLGAVRVLAGWLLHLRGLGAPVQDAGLTATDRAALGAPDLVNAASAVCGWCGLEDARLVAAVVDQARQLQHITGSRT